ncbi:MAG: ATP-binding protein [Salinibacter sp.]|uniref:sensor histidine kinase n=1 Tax=Salinibacter sp. TaxID=2065818 RepID=UPI0035D4AD8E
MKTPAHDNSQAGQGDEQVRPSFRRRLLTTVGPALAGAFAALALIAWGAAYVTVHSSALNALKFEVKEVQANVRVRNGQLNVEEYAWNEVHHRLATGRIDPVFVQVFDSNGELVRASANVDSLSGAYPDRPFEPHTSGFWVPTLHTFEVDGRRLYYRTRPLRGSKGKTVGFVQVSRVVPARHAMLWTFGAGLVGLWAVLTAGLLALVGWSAGRVLRPLRRITKGARSITSEDLDTRVEIPSGADRETATLGHALNALLDRIKEHVDALRTFTANAAHELQTPLTVLHGHVEVALRRDRDAESYRETLRLLDAKLGELTRALRALLTLTRLDRSDAVERTPVDLAAIAEEEVASFQPRAEEKGLSLTAETDDAAWVEGQPDLLREAVRNLVDNALKYTPEGEVTVAVEREGSGPVRLTCTDTGVGMEPGEVERVTDRFYRGAGAGNVEAEGSGLGLSLACRIVEEHDGQLQIDSTPGEGTRVTVTLPTAPEPSSADVSDEKRSGVPAK